MTFADEVVEAHVANLIKLSGIPKGMARAGGEGMDVARQTYLYNRVNAHAFGRNSGGSKFPRLGARLEARAIGKSNKKTALRALEKSAMPAFLDELEKIALTPPAQPGMLRRGANWAGRQFVEGGENVGKAIGAFATPMKSFKRGWHESWTSAHPVFKGLMAYGAVAGIPSVMKKQDPSGQGHSRLRRGLQLAGDQVGGIIAAPFGLAGGITGSVIGGRIGGAAGRIIDRARGYKTPIHLPPPPVGQQGAAPLTPAHQV